jgi:uncharacterized membrane protein YqhA
MSRLLERSKYMVLIAVVALLAAALATFGWGALKTVYFVAGLIGSAGADPLSVIALLDTVDTFLVGTVLLITALGLYELFIGPLELPEWLVIKDLNSLKSKLSDVIVLFMAIKFLDKLVQSKNALDTLWLALAVAVVSAALIAYNQLRPPKEK